MQVSQSSKVRLSDLIHQLLLHSYKKFRSLSQKLSSMGDVEKKIKLIKYFKTTRIQFVRLLVLLNACKEFSVLEKSLKLIENLNIQDGSFTETADQLYWLQDIYLHTKMGSERVPIYDIPSSIDILSTGSFRRLPQSIESPKEVLPFLLHERKLSDEELKTVKSKLNEIMSIKLLLEEDVPQYVTCTIEDGKLTLEIKNEYKVILSFTNENEGVFTWKIIEIDIFITPEDGLQYIGVFHLNSIHYEAQELINNSDKPLLALCTFMDSLSQSLQLEILHSQILNYKRSKDTSFVIVDDIVFEEGVSLKITLWKEMEIRKNITMEIYPTSPNERIEYNSSSLTVSTTPSLIDTNGNLVRVKSEANDLSIQTLIQLSLTYHCHHYISNLYNELVAYFKENSPSVAPNSINFTISHHDILLISNNDLSYSAIKVRIFDERFISIIIGLNDGKFKIEGLPEDLEINLKEVNDNMNTLEGIIKSLITVQSLIVKNSILKIIQSYQVPVNDKGYFSDVYNRFGKDTLLVRISSLDCVQNNLIITFSTEYLKPLKNPVYVNMKMYKLTSEGFSLIPIDEILISLQLKTSPKINNIESNTLKMKRQKLNTEEEDEEYMNIDEMISSYSKNDFYKLFSKLLLSNRRKFYSVLIDTISNNEKFILLNQDFDENEQIVRCKLEYLLKDSKIPINIIIQNGYWTAILAMGNKIKYPVRDTYLENSEYHFSADENKWIFKYQNFDSSSFERFEKDFLDLVEILYMLYQYEEYTNQNDHSSFFQVDYISFNSLCIKYGDKKDCHIIFFMKQLTRDIKMYPESCFKYFISQSFISNKNMIKILEMLWNTYLTEKYINIKSESSTQILIHTAPQSLHQMRLKIGSIYFDLRFVGNRTLFLTLETPKPPIDNIFIAVSLDDIKKRDEYSKYIINFKEEPKVQITENIFAFSDVYFPPLFDRIYSKLKN